MPEPSESENVLSKRLKRVLETRLEDDQVISTYDNYYIRD